MPMQSVVVVSHLVRAATRERESSDVRQVSGIHCDYFINEASTEAIETRRECARRRRRETQEIPK